MERGYIKLYRKLLDNGIIQNPHAWQLFGYLLLNAAYKPISRDFYGIMVRLEPGQVAIGRKKVAEYLKMSEQNVRTALKYLERNEIITSKSTSKYTLISIINWGCYQSEGANDNQVSNQQLTNSQPTANQQLTNSQPTANQQLTTIKEFKNLRKKEGEKERTGEGNNQNKEGESPPSPLVGSEGSPSSADKPKRKKDTGNTLPEMEHAIEVYTSNPDLREALLGWLEMRCVTPGKKPTGRALKQAFNKLDSLAANDAEKIAIVNESTVRNWTSFFELTKYGANRQKPGTRYNPADRDKYVFEQNQQMAKRWLEREKQKQESKNGHGDESESS